MRVLPRGVNLPWIRYGGDFGANAWSPAGGLSTRDRDDLHRSLDRAAAAGADVVRWFVLCDGRAGITFDATGTPRALQPVVLDDVATALAALQTHGLRMVPVLFDFTWGDARRLVDGVPLGGRAHVLKDPVSRHALWQVTDTLVDAFGRHPGIAMWDLWNEPDWLVAPWRPPARRLSARRLRQCLGRARPPRQMARDATGHGGPRKRARPSALSRPWRSTCCRCTGTTISSAGRPWPGARTWHGATRRGCSASSRRAAARDARRTSWPTAREAGYAAAWPWSLHADDRNSEAQATLDVLVHARDHVMPMPDA